MATGRWLSRDPIQESGGKNLYRFARNQLISRIDRRGLVDAGPYEVTWASQDDDWAHSGKSKHPLTVTPKCEPAACDVAGSNGVAKAYGTWEACRQVSIKRWDSE